ncbi:MAG: hypothetical protein FK734_14395 [Asgard group archaeon]|nr:hypothetical protein [Asgard group archaeon]
MSLFCCKCGKTDAEEPIYEGFCLSCYKDEFPLIISFPEKQFNLTTCKQCGDLMYNGKWVEVGNNPHPTIMEFIGEFISKTKKLPGTELVVVSEIEDPPFDVASKQDLKLIFEGTTKEEIPPYQQEIDLLMVVNLGVCERCAKFIRGYFETIVQIRCDRRPINEEEQFAISDFIKQKQKEAIETDRMAYISKTVDQLRGGIDLYVGSENFAKHLANFLAEQLAAAIETSRKLKSEKDGKPIYQTTICVRLPNFEIGDVVNYQKRYYQIEGINFGRVVLFDLISHESKTLSLKESNPEALMIVKKQDQFQEYIIMAIQEKTTSVMNKDTFETVDINNEFFLEGHEEGDKITMVELETGIFECKQF